MAYLMLYGVGGWSQRWEIAEGQDETVRSEISRVGNQGTGHLHVVDPTSEDATTLVVAWAAIATAVVVESDGHRQDEHTGRYA